MSTPIGILLFRIDIPPALLDREDGGLLYFPPWTAKAEPWLPVKRPSPTRRVQTNRNNDSKECRMKYLILLASSRTVLFNQ